MKDTLLGAEDTKKYNSSFEAYDLFGKAGLLCKKKVILVMWLMSDKSISVIVGRSVRKVFTKEVILDLYPQGFW